MACRCWRGAQRVGVQISEQKATGQKAGRRSGRLFRLPWLGRRVVTVPFSRLHALFGELDDVPPEQDNLAIRRAAKYLIERVNCRDNFLPARREFHTYQSGIITMSVPYNKLRISHPIKNYVERLNVLLELFIFWLHGVWFGALLQPNK